jgi:hypothetical protein
LLAGWLRHAKSDFSSCPGVAAQAARSSHLTTHGKTDKFSRDQIHTQDTVSQNQLPLNVQPVIPARPVIQRIAIAAATLSCLFASAAHASLTVTVVPVAAPAAHTLWTFSGSSVYTQLNPGGKFAGEPFGNIVEWKGDGGSDYVKTGTYNNYIASLLSGSIQINVTPAAGLPTPGSIAGLHIDHDSSGDDFGTGLQGIVDIPLANNDVVSWSGSGIFPVDIANLNIGTFAFSKYGETASIPSQPFGTLPLTMNVQVPGPLPWLGCGLAFSFSRTLRRRIQALQ